MVKRLQRKTAIRIYKAPMTAEKISHHELATVCLFQAPDSLIVSRGKQTSQQLQRLGTNTGSNSFTTEALRLVLQHIQTPCPQVCGSK